MKIPLNLHVLVTVHQGVVNDVELFGSEEPFLERFHAETGGKYRDAAEWNAPGRHRRLKGYGDLERAQVACHTWLVRALERKPRKLTK